MRNRRGSASGPHILIIVQNLPVPLDRRVWLECQALIARGYRVSVICPKGPGDPARETPRRGRHLQVRPRTRGGRLAGLAWEFAYSWLRTALLSLTVRRRGRFDVIQACNPPDTYWLLALLWRTRRSEVRLRPPRPEPGTVHLAFREPRRPAEVARVPRPALARAPHLPDADRVISTNESYKAIAIRRGRPPAERGDRGAQRTGHPADAPDLPRAPPRS